MKTKSAVIMILLFLSSCVSPKATIEGSVLATETTHPQTTTPSVSASDSNTPSPSVTVADPEDPGLDSEGPWLIYKTSGNDVLILNKDGSGRTQLPDLDFSLINPYDASRSLPMIAVSTVDRELNHSQSIDIISIPELQIIQHIPLQSCPEVIPGCEIHPQASFSFEPIWSPNGRYLAFIGAIEGPSTDVYVYDGQEGLVKRLTDGPNQVGWYFWSPDSKWIVHEEVSDFLGWQVESIWAASPITEEVQWIYSPESKRSQSLLGWIDNDRFISYEHSMYGEGNLVLANINDGIVSSLFPGVFHDDVALDPETGTVAFFPAVGAPNTDLRESGIYTISINNTNPKRIEIDDLNILGWDKNTGYFLTSADCSEIPDGILGFTPDGSVSCIKETISSKSPNSSWEVLFEEGIHLINPEGESTLLLAGHTYGDVFWRPDSEGAFIIPDGNIYYLDLSTLELEFINNDLVSTFNTIDGRNSALIMWVGE